AAYDAPLSNWRTYVLQSGEKLEDIAPRFGITLADLRRINGLDKKARIASGQTLLVPGKSSEALDLDAFPATASISSAERTTTVKTHTVKKGETLQAIARKYDMNVSDLKRLNKLKSNQIAAGKKLTLTAAVSETTRSEKTKAEKPQKAETQKTQQATRKNSATKVTHHKVKKGDTLFAIAKRYKVDQDDIKRWNKLAGSQLKVGSTITIQLDS
ncbi:MAG: LysM peptidoglycan-binding domain-containing protein, partial [Azovibrio sp.]